MDVNNLIYNILCILDDKYMCVFMDNHIEYRDLNDREVSLFMHIPDLYYRKNGYKMVQYGNKMRLVKK